MSRLLEYQNGVYVDVQDLPHKPFNGVVPRDLEIGDRYEIEDSGGTITVNIVTNKTSQDGRITVSTEEV